MLLFAAAALLPRLFWDAGPETAPALKTAGIERIATPAARAAAWKGVDGISVEAADLQGAVKLVPPSVDYRANQGSASRAPWINTNGWRFQRQPAARFWYDVKGPQSALAAAEAFSFGADALIRSDEAGLKPLAEILAFLRGVPADDLTPVADIGFQDDGTAASGEVMNLLVKSNLLFRRVSAPDPGLKLNVKIGTKDFPLADTKNPIVMAQLIRSKLTDEKRSVRVYGSLVVIARVTGAKDRLRVQLMNYAGDARKIDGLRVRVLGKYAKAEVRAAGAPDEKLLDVTQEPDATEFTLPELKTYAVIDLKK